MSRQKTILFACGTGIATSTAVNVAVTEAMKKRGLTFNAQQAKATEVPGLADAEAAAGHPGLRKADPCRQIRRSRARRDVRE